MKGRRGPSETVLCDQISLPPVIRPLSLKAQRLLSSLLSVSSKCWRSSGALYLCVRLCVPLYWGQHTAMSTLPFNKRPLTRDQTLGKDHLHGPGWHLQWWKTQGDLIHIGLTWCPHALLHLCLVNWDATW